MTFKKTYYTYTWEDYKTIWNPFVISTVFIGMRKVEYEKTILWQGRIVRYNVSSLIKNDIMMADGSTVHVFFEPMKSWHGEVMTEKQMFHSSQYVKKALLKTFREN